MIVSLIAAQSTNRIIGINNNLPWDIPEDLNYFKEKTRGKIIIMGRKTFESLPKMLPKRFHIVISRNPAPSTTQNQDMVVWVNSIEQALATAKNLIPQWPEEVFIIGGGEIYTQSLAFTDRIYLTQIHKEFNGDAYFPEFDKSKFKLVSSTKGHTESQKNPQLSFDYQIFERA